jgi:hypothetical protein
MEVGQMSQAVAVGVETLDLLEVFGELDQEHLAVL